MLILVGSLLALSPAHAAPARILAIGDSITRGVGGQCSFRRDLSQSLFNNSECDVSFVGPLIGSENSPQACQATATRHAGYSGRKADRFLSDDLITLYMDDYSPDYVLIHLGSNDIAQGDSVSSTVDEIDLIITQTLDNRPTAKVMLANVIPWDPRVSDNPNVDELARTAELSSALNELVIRRSESGEAVFLVDVASGFDSAGMTFDGIHPNDAGEAFMASRFLGSMNNAGICGATPAELPTLTLADNQWAQISLPADPGINGSVADIFDELPIGEYNSSWVVYGTDFSNDTLFDYEKLALNSPMNTGQAYWVIQRTGEAAVSISMPPGSVPVQTAVETGCVPGKACYAASLRTRPDKLFWNFVGYPFPTGSSVANTRILASSGGCTSGCTLDEASSNLIAGNLMFHYEPGENTSSDYRTLVNQEDPINAWNGLWLPVLPGAHDQSPRILFAP